MRKQSRIKGNSVVLDLLPIDGKTRATLEFDGANIILDQPLSIQPSSSLVDSEIFVDKITEKSSTSGVTVEGVLLKDSIVSVDTISEKTSTTGVTIDGVLVKDGVIKASSIKPASAYGTAAAGVTTTEYGDSRNMTVVLSFTGLVLGAPTAGGNSAHGAILHTFPNSNILVTAITTKVGLTVGTVTTDTPDVGLGTVIGSGAVNVLSATGTFEDIITGQTWNAALDGTADYFGTLPSGVVTDATAFPLIKSAGAGTKVHLNAAGGWNAGVTGNLTATGTVVINYIFVI